MKTALSIFLFFSFSYSSFAQTQWKNLAPLPCDTWGKPQWSSYEPYPNAYGNEISKEVFLSFDQNYNISFISPDINYTTYINNIQIIRWQIKNTAYTYDVKILNMYDEVIYQVKAEQCGLIIFPDSLLEEDVPYVRMSIAVSNSEERIPPISFGTKAVEDISRKAILNQLKNCPTIDCKIDLLVRQNKIWDAMSVLELERMRDPDNLALYSLYWDLARKARVNWAYKSYER